MIRYEDREGMSSIMPWEDIAAWVSTHLGSIGVGFFILVGLWRIQLTNSRAKYAKKVLKKAIDTQTHEPLTLHPEVDPKRCAGCGSCTRVCPEGDILKLIDHKAVLIKPTKCVGHGECEIACPTHAITLVFGTKSRGMDIPRITTNYETNVPGLYIAGELGGMGLIRNAVKQGHLAAKHAFENLGNATDPADTDLLIVGAGPAGLTAGLTAIAEKKSYVCIEQNSFGGTVYNFPRQKVVMTHPAELPLVGTMRFKGNKVSKEELLDYWNSVRKKTGMEVREGVRFETVEKKGSIFEVKTSKGLIRAKKVMLCMGVRGSPRRLGLPNEDLPKVAYNLIDPEQYQDQDVAVVGGGNAGVEAAQYLAKPQYRNRVKLLVRGKDFDRCNEENKKIVIGMAEKGQLEIWFESSVKEIQPEKLQITRAGEVKEVPNHFLFIFAGAEMPHKFLMSLGIDIDKKFGESLGKSTG